MAKDIGGLHLRTITATAYRRPHLLKAMLETLLANELAGWRVLIQIDPSPVADDMARIAESLLDGHDRDIVINAARLGVRENPYRLLERAFGEGSALNLYLEEDLLLAPDATRLASWYEANHRPEWLCLNLIAGGCASTGLLSNPDYPALLFAGPTFNSLGFAVRRQEWQRLMAPAWMTERDGVVKFDGKATGGWDWQIYSLLLDDPRLRTLQPVLARAIHNGRLAGEHCTPRFHDLAFAGLPIYRGAAAAPDYCLLAAAELPIAVRRHALLWKEMSWALRALNQKAQQPFPGAGTS
ncbi:MAG TPA: hypothetical protein VN821_11200 [Candidatus Udaeobacter sp.]|nr:hypothetical protein [Candidatus Udaeobacter sp.]